MALNIEELFSSASRAARARVTPDHRGLYVATFAANALAELLIAGCPVSYNDSTDLWEPYTQPSDSSIQVLTANATPATAGTMEIHVDGLSVEVAFDVTAVAAAAAINAVLADAGKDYTVVGVDTVATDLGDANHVATFTFSENAGAPSWDVAMGGLTGNAPAESTTDAGTALAGTNKIRGIVFEDSIQIHASDEVLGVIMVKGEVESDDVNTAAVRALLRGTPSSAELLIALGDPELKDAGIMVRGLSTVH